MEIEEDKLVFIVEDGDLDVDLFKDFKKGECLCDLCCIV